MTQTLDQAGALYLGKVVSTLFPREVYFGSGVERGAFFATFSHSSPFDSSLLEWVEREMRTLCKLEEISSVEMAAVSARALFVHKGQIELSRLLEGQKGTVFVGHVGDFTDLLEGDVAPLSHFSLTEYVQEKGRVTLWGRAFASDKEKKAFAKSLASYDKNGHETIAKNLELYEVTREGILWLPRGVQLRSLILDYLSEYLRRAEIPEILLPEGWGPREAKSVGICPFAYGGEGEIFCDRPDLLENFFSPFALETYWEFIPSGHGKADAPFKKILPKEGRTLSPSAKGPRLELLCRDALGRPVLLSSLERGDGGIHYRLIADLKNLVSLLLESSKGELPFWLAPLQVAIFPLSEVDLRPLKTLLSKFTIRYSVEKISQKVGENLQQALRLKVPYGIFFGKREETAQIVSVRTFSSKEDEKMTFMQLEDLLLQRKFELESQ